MNKTVLSCRMKVINNLVILEILSDLNLYHQMGCYRWREKGENVFDKRLGYSVPKFIEVNSTNEFKIVYDVSHRITMTLYWERLHLDLQSVEGYGRSRDFIDVQTIFYSKEYAISVILSFGTKVEIISPESLKDDLIAHIYKIRKIYIGRK